MNANQQPSISPSKRCYAVRSVGVDWISATATGQRVRQAVARTAKRLLDAEAGADNNPRAWRWKGYVGQQCGAVTAGERADSYFCQVSGHSASLYWLALLDHPVNVTRLDLQVTVGGVPPKADLARAEWERIDADGNLQRQAGWRSWITTRPTGSTLYVGSPKSDRRLRLYDKHAEDPLGHPPGCWRYELQARRDVAGSIAAALSGSDRCTDAILGTVHKCFRSRAVVPHFRPAAGGVLGNVPRARSDAERRLLWLSRQVRPTVDWLRDRGYGDHVDALFRLSGN